MQCSLVIPRQANGSYLSELCEEYPAAYKSYSCENAHEVAVEYGGLDELMAEYQLITQQLDEAQRALKPELLTALNATSGDAA
ncbi:MULTISPECIES: hypothetical protein [Achromobacter]|uniref:Uncharacterized protein n=2 Tax=Achromobacter TaxID=222 RepID=A0A848N9F7_9BURK|nr:hypothetical protein [Achromobacter ruhlandii]MCV6795209.1 hypothetical protein [Achromobacter ruhlandii]MCV6800681.1 hypothetical protein [Achromobacter ruhlandii]MCV6807050.1 hypothetical protein [Achromobacter ruhlandii]MCV6821960.1 hypothetical protein [Achromobacter ruhlandii]MCZ8396443.1 hypothetical protein [Achromobacter ruhlandii]